MSFPQWRAGQVITADDLNARNWTMIVQGDEMSFSNQTTELDTNVQIPVEANATYMYHLYISYSAVNDADSCLVGSWSVPSGTSHLRFTTSNEAAPGTGVNTGKSIINRSPASATSQLMGGSDASPPPGNFHSAYDRGTWAIGATAGTMVWRVRQGFSGSSNVTVLRAGTRILYARIG